MNPRISTLILLSIIAVVTSAIHHNSEGQEAEYSQLLKQQAQFENQLSLIESDMAVAMSKLRAASSTA
jgi:hypothetical protein